MSAPIGPAPVRLAELLASLSLGIDLGFGQPMGHVLRQCLIALRLGEQLDLDEAERATVYYAALLVNVGCITDAHEQAKWFGDDVALKATKYEYEPRTLAEAVGSLRLLGSGSGPIHRIRTILDFIVTGRSETADMITLHAERACDLGEQLRLEPPVLAALVASYERWDGKGWPGRLRGDAIPLAARIVQLAEFVEVAHRTDGVGGALTLAAQRRGSQFDPRLVDVLHLDAEKVFGDVDDIGSWDAIIDSEPALTVELDDERCDEALRAIARFVDVKSPFMVGHSLAVAELARTTAVRLGGSDDVAREVYRAGLIAGYGRLGVSNAIWDKRGQLSAGDWERVRLHPYLTERMVQRSPTLAGPGRLAVRLRERLDGSGYPNQLSAREISPLARVLAVADAYQAMREPRPYREPRSAAEAAAALRAEVVAGRLDADAVEGVLAVSGHRVVRRREGPQGLTRREVEVLRLLVLGLATKDIAARLVISPKTARNHIEHIYTKVGVSNRAGASLFAMTHGLLPVEGFSTLA